MNTPNDGGPAFPQPNHIVEHDSQGRVEARNWMQDSGMTLRDWFAGMALQGLLSANPQCPDAVSEENVDSVIAREAYRSADAMIAERSKPTK